MTLTFFSFRPADNGHAKKKWVVVIDAGHGGKDPGCHGLHFKEKNIALAIALKLGHYLQKNDKNVQVIYTRKTDVFIPLNERAEIANRNHADFFICIHCNASPDHDAQGSATYVMGLNKSKGNLEVAKRENASILYEKDYKRTYDGFDPNSDEAAVLFAMYQNLYLNQSLDLASKIQNEYTELVKTTDNGVKQAGFLVLWKTDMPSLLTEVGFLTNPEQEVLLGSQKGQNKIAKSIFLAFEQYKAEKDGSAYTPAIYNYTPLDYKIPGNAKLAQSKQTNVIDTAHTTDSNNIVADRTNQTTKAEQGSTSPFADSASALPTKNHSFPQPDSAPVKVTNMQKAVKALQTNNTPASNFTQPDSSKADNSTRIVYKVQFISSPRPLPVHSAKYVALPDLEMYMANTTYKYTVGHFYDVKKAIALEYKMRNMGYKGAFVVTFKNHKRIKVTKPSAK